MAKRKQTFSNRMTMIMMRVRKVKRKNRQNIDFVGMQKYNTNARYKC